MRRFGCVLASGFASACVLGCGGSSAVDYFSGGGGSAGASVRHEDSSASAGQSAAGSSSVDRSGGVGGSDTSSGGDTGSGGASSDATAGSSGALSSSGTAGAPSTGACAPVDDIGSGVSFASAGPVCLKVTLDITGWGCSNFQGRTVKVNGTTVSCAELPLPSKVDDAYYFDVSAGEHDYASLFWY